MIYKLVSYRFVIELYVLSETKTKTSLSRHIDLWKCKCPDMAVAVVLSPGWGGGAVTRTGDPHAASTAWQVHTWALAFLGTHTAGLYLNQLRLQTPFLCHLFWKLFLCPQLKQSFPLIISVSLYLNAWPYGSDPFLPLHLDCTFLGGQSPGIVLSVITVVYITDLTSPWWTGHLQGDRGPSKIYPMSSSQCIDQGENKRKFLPVSWLPLHF